MSGVLSRLQILLHADTANYRREMKRTKNETKSTFQQMQADAKRWAKATPAALGIAATALTVATTAQVRYANEVAKTAAVANSGVVEIQKYTLAAKTMGVEQDKVGDIFKDTSDKVGDFLSTGAGPMADFFENIAPQVGVTADEFRKLSGPDALQLYYDSLEKANLSQNEMTFYMEAVASDATALIPLLRDGGAGFDFWATAAENAGAVMDEKTIRASQELEASTELLKLSYKGITNQVTQAVIPMVSDLAGALVGSANAKETARIAGEKLVAGLKFLAKVGNVVVTVFRVVGKVIGGVFATLGTALKGVSLTDNPFMVGIKMAGNIRETGGVIRDVYTDINAEMSKAAATSKKIDNLGTSGTNAIVKQATDLKQRQNDVRKSLARTGQQYQAVTNAAKKSTDKRAQLAKQLADEEARQAQRAAEAAKRAYEQVRDAASPPAQKINAELNQRINAIKGIGGGASEQEKTRLRNWARAQYNESMAQLQVNNERRLSEFDEVYKTQEQIITDYYNQEKLLIEHSTQYTDDQRKKALYANMVLRETEVERYRLDEEKKLRSMTEFNQTAIEKIRYRYQYERDQLAINIKLDDEAKARRLDAINAQEQNAVFNMQKQAGTAFGRQQAEMNGAGEIFQLKEQHQKRLEVIKAAKEAEVITVQQAEAAKAQAVQYHGMAMLGSVTRSAKAIFGAHSKFHRITLAAEKAASIYRAAMAIKTAIAQAAAVPFPANIGAMITVASATAGIVTDIKSLKQPQMPGYYVGGFTGYGNPREVAGNVHKNEYVFDHKATQRIGVNKLERIRKGETERSNIIINNYGNDKVSAEQHDNGDIEITIISVVDKYLPQQFSNPNSRIMSGLMRSSNVQPKR